MDDIGDILNDKPDCPPAPPCEPGPKREPRPWKPEDLCRIVRAIELNGHSQASIRIALKLCIIDVDDQRQREALAILAVAILAILGKSITAIGKITKLRTAIPAIAASRILTALQKRETIAAIRTLPTTQTRLKAANQVLEAELDGLRGTGVVIRP